MIADNRNDIHYLAYFFFLAHLTGGIPENIDTILRKQSSDKTDTMQKNEFVGIIRINKKLCLFCVNGMGIGPRSKQFVADIQHIQYLSNDMIDQFVDRFRMMIKPR